MTERRVAARTRRLFRSRTLIITLVLYAQRGCWEAEWSRSWKAFSEVFVTSLRESHFSKMQRWKISTWLVQINTLSSNHTRSHTDRLFLKSLFECHESSFQDLERKKKKQPKEGISGYLRTLLLVWKVNWCLKQNNQEIPCLWTVCTFWKGLLGIE